MLSLDGEHYEIELTTESYDTLLKAPARFTQGLRCRPPHLRKSQAERRDH